jgi:Flp pilus assembly CpaF family ATPase
MAAAQPPLNIKDTALRQFLSHMSLIRPYIDDPSIQEIMINSPNEVFIERRGEMTRADIELPSVSIKGALAALATANSKDRVQVIMDARMPGYRIASALDPVGIKGPALCIRKHSSSARTLDDYVTDGAFSPAVREEENLFTEAPPPESSISEGGTALKSFLEWMVRARKNIIVAGATGSGKTTLLNAMISAIPDTDRVLTIEDTAELKVTVPNHVGFETLDAHNITIRSLVRLALRFRPDRIIVGEVRGPEAYDLLDAMSTGHPGGFCSLHADDPVFALSRLETMAQMHPDAQNLPAHALRRKIADTFDYVIYCERRGGIRRPVEIAKILPLKDHEYQIQALYRTEDRQ